MIEGTVEQIVKVTAPKISIFYRIILVIACLLAATTIVQTGWLGVIAVSYTHLDVYKRQVKFILCSS